ncbi:hypothetical protein LJK88_01870 [Paenibacillus sp. P26]|nr:hypothetical protein LJK88_01870 [Paenibacillus sp. P26]UUZ91054.1 hypothetical protein LJK87_35615 [Paenibacillus sp. P25]
MRNVSIDYIILMIVYAVSLIGLWLVPGEKKRRAQAAYLFFGMPMWILGLTVVEAGWIEYPVRDFRVASQTSFVFEYLAFPTVSVYFNLYYPQHRSRWIQCLYYTGFASGLTLPEYFIEKYTQLIEYKGWAWYWSFISITLTLWLSRRFYEWFFRLKGKT